MASINKLLLLGGVGAAAAALLLKRDKVTALLPGRSGGSAESTAAPSWEPAPATGPSNYDAPGPVANTATPVPAPEPEVVSDSGAIDEAAEEAAAAAEAANIGGTVADYADDDDPSLAADEAERPLMEAGEGWAEGRDQAEAELLAAAEPDPAPGISDYQRQIDDVIEEASVPSAGEQVEPLAPIEADREPEGALHPPAEPLFGQTPGLPETGAGDAPASTGEIPSPAPGLPDTGAAEAAAAAAQSVESRSVTDASDLGGTPPSATDDVGGTAPGLPDTGAAQRASEPAGLSDAVGPDAPTQEWKPPVPPQPAPPTEPLGEAPPPPAPPEPGPAAGVPPAPAPEDEGSAAYETFAMPSVPRREPEPDPAVADDEPGAPAAAGGEEEPPAEPTSPADPPSKPDEGGSDWQTWSGRSINP